MTQEQKDTIEEIKAVGFLLSVTDNSADVPPEVLNRIGDLIQDELNKVE